MYYTVHMSNITIMLKYIYSSIRQPVTTLLQYLLPSALIGILLLVKLMMPPSEFKTCQFRARTGRFGHQVIFVNKLRKILKL